MDLNDEIHTSSPNNTHNSTVISFLSQTIPSQLQIHSFLPVQLPSLSPPRRTLQTNTLPLTQPPYAFPPQTSNPPPLPNKTVSVSRRQKLE